MSRNTSRTDLRGAFEQFGIVNEVQIILHAVSGESRGFGFVVFAEADEANAARAAMDGIELDGKVLRVDESAERLENDGGQNRRY